MGGQTLPKKKNKRKAAKRRTSTTARRRPSTSGSRSRASSAPRKPSRSAVKKVIRHNAMGSATAIGTRALIEKTDMGKGVDRDVVDGVQAGGGVLISVTGYFLNSPLLVTMGAHQATAAGASYLTRTTMEKPVTQGAGASTPLELFRDGLNTSGIPLAEADAMVADLLSPEVAGPMMLTQLIKAALRRLMKGGAEQARAAQDITVAAAGLCHMDPDGYGATETGRLGKNRLGFFKRVREGLRKRREERGPSKRQMRREAAEAADTHSAPEPKALPDPYQQAEQDPEAEEILRQLNAVL